MVLALRDFEVIAYKCICRKMINNPLGPLIKGGKVTMAGGPFLTDRVIKRIIKLYENTVLTQDEIAETLQISQNSVSRVLKDYGNGKLQFSVGSDS